MQSIRDPPLRALIVGCGLGKLHTPFTTPESLPATSTTNSEPQTIQEA